MALHEMMPSVVSHWGYSSAELLSIAYSCGAGLTQENNFKAVLESIRDLMNEDTVLPEWLHDIFLGYGDPAAAQYTKLPNTLRTLDFKVGSCGRP
jgi:hypothetical protein